LQPDQVIQVAMERFPRVLDPVEVLRFAGEICQRDLLLVQEQVENPDLLT
jgi:hypothetical protein